MAYVSDTIAQVWATEKCLEARNTLNIAYPCDYAMLQGAGGENHARVSGIYTCITDISQKAKQQNKGISPTIGATVPTVEFTKAKKIAEFNLGTTHLDDGDITKGFNAIGAIAAYVYAIFAMLVKIVTSVGVTAGNIITGRPVDIPSIICNSAKEARKILADNSKQVYGMERVDVPVYKDWEYSQNRVNTYKKYPDGRVSVAVLSISRKQYQMINGSEVRQNKPWSVYVSNFRAFPVEQKNGTVSYNGSSKADEMAARIKLDDEQMFDFCNKIEHFETVWELTHCCGLLREGLRLKEEQRRENIGG